MSETSLQDALWLARGLKPMERLVALGIAQLGSEKASKRSIAGLCEMDDGAARRALDGLRARGLLPAKASGNTGVQADYTLRVPHVAGALSTRSPGAPDTRTGGSQHPVRAPSECRSSLSDLTAVLKTAVKSERTLCNTGFPTGSSERPVALSTRFTWEIWPVAPQPEVPRFHGNAATHLPAHRTLQATSQRSSVRREEPEKRPRKRRALGAAEARAIQEREDLQRLCERRAHIRGLTGFRDPKPGESCREYLAAQESAWTAWQSAQPQAPRPWEPGHPDYRPTVPGTARAGNAGPIARSLLRTQTNAS